MDDYGVGGFKAGPVTQPSVDNSEVKKNKSGSMKGKKVSGKYKYPPKKKMWFHLLLRMLKKNRSVTESQRHLTHSLGVVISREGMMPWWAHSIAHMRP